MNLERLDWILIKVQDAETMTDWETRFVVDITEQRERFGKNLVISERQEEILERISEKG